MFAGIFPSEWKTRGDATFCVFVSRAHVYEALSRSGSHITVAGVSKKIEVNGELYQLLDIKHPRSRSGTTATYSLRTTTTAGLAEDSTT